MKGRNNGSLSIFQYLNYFACRDILTNFVICRFFLSKNAIRVSNIQAVCKSYQHTEIVVPSRGMVKQFDKIGH